MTLNGVMTTDVRHLCGSWVSRKKCDCTFRSRSSQSTVSISGYFMLSGTLVGRRCAFI